MGKSFDIGLERLTGTGVAETEALEASDQGTQAGVPVPQGSTFYLETFGCQMNDHESE